MAPKPCRFQATIYRIWMMRHIDVPDEIARELLEEMTRVGPVKTQPEPLKRTVGTAARGGRSARQEVGPGDTAPRKQAKRDKQANSNPKYIPVAAIVNGKSARTTLVPAGGGRFRMQINTALRKAARADVGDLVGVELRLDLASRDLPLPPDLKAGLKQHPKAWKAFQALAPGHRRHFIHWYDSAKSTAARDRRLNRAIDVLLERALLGPRPRQKR